eukprot:3330891-Amphidinium_carterae.1
MPLSLSRVVCSHASSLHEPLADQAAFKSVQDKSQTSVRTCVLVCAPVLSRSEMVVVAHFICVDMTSSCALLGCCSAAIVQSCSRRARAKERLSRKGSTKFPDRLLRLGRARREEEEYPKNGFAPTLHGWSRCALVSSSRGARDLWKFAEVLMCLVTTISLHQLKHTADGRHHRFDIAALRLLM